jgi:AraC family transcriptional regulator, regulatory protein of adaptative response / methylated-DNA-[protein]-cysteine methyltransferase
MAETKTSGLRASGSTAGPSDAALIEADPRWQQVVARDRTADASFYYSVRTTGIYCRPGCAARLPKPENVRFHPTIADAEAAGFRPCQRCRPGQPSLDQRHATLVANACCAIAMSENVPDLARLAEEAGLSPFHFHRLFKRVTGLTPRAYANARRAERVRDSLAGADRVTDAIYDAGFASGSRFYAQADAMLGMKAARYRKGGEDMVIRFAIGETSLGAILVAASETGLCAILMGDDPDALARDLQDRFPNATLVGGEAEFESIVAKVVGLVEAPGLGLDLPLDVRGTAFQQRVWQALTELPAGSTASYADVARAIGAPGAVRAVAQACGANALAVAIPCHRVVRTDGALSGYRWGVERKRALLDREARQRT